MDTRCSAGIREVVVCAWIDRPTHASPLEQMPGRDQPESFKPAFVQRPSVKGRLQFLESPFLYQVGDLEIEGAVMTAHNMQNLFPVAAFWGDGLVVPVTEDLLSEPFGIYPG